MTEEQNCEEQVFPLAVNLLDRFLALEASVLQRCQLQLLGCVCLLTASKLRQCRPIGVELLVYYTDYSVTPAQIRVSTFIIFFWANFDRKMCGPTTCAISGLTTQSSGHHFFSLVKYVQLSEWRKERKSTLNGRCRKGDLSFDLFCAAGGNNSCQKEGGRVTRFVLTSCCFRWIKVGSLVYKMFVLLTLWTQSNRFVYSLRPLRQWRQYAWNVPRQV